MKYPTFFLIAVIAVLLYSCNSGKQKGNEVPRPNVVIIYADDLGYGDVSAYGATEINTPNIDRLARGGIRFTNGYSSSATCSPSRYALLTGSYPWRNENAKILDGTAPLLISTEQMTLPKMFKEQGYHTGIVGKWHLGLGDGHVDWNVKIAPGPNEVGFDYAYIMAATQDRVPTVYIKNGMVVRSDPNDPIEVSYEQNFPGEPTGMDNPELLKMKWHHGHFNSVVNGISRIGYMKGGAEARWVDENMADTFLLKAQDYIMDHKEKPFFLYYTLQQPHVPRTPHPRFVGKTSMGPRGDVIVEADWCIGELISTLEEAGVLENTMIILSSDNGPVLNDGYYDDADTKVGSHTPAGPLRGGKYSLFEAGTRIPFITYWKGHITPAVSDAMVSQVDLFASLASLAGSEVKSDDSENLLQVLLGEEKLGRSELIMEATGRTALRKGDWVLIPPYEGRALASEVNIELGNATEYQLYNLNEDLGEQQNLAHINPEKLKEMITTFQAIRGVSDEVSGELELK
jgi:arylsulfatase A-like enzyme